MVLAADCTIRRATAADAGALAAVDAASVEARPVRQVIKPLPRVDFFTFVRSNGHGGAACYVAIDTPSGRALGFVFVDVEEVSLNGRPTKCAYVFHFRVHPAYQRRGVGSALLRHAEREAVAAGAQVCWAAVVEGNTPARSIFGRLGYAPLARLTYKAMPLLLAGRWPWRASGMYRLRAATPDDAAAVAALQESYYAGHQFWRPRLYVPAAGYVATDQRGNVLASANCFRLYEIGESQVLGRKGLPPPVSAALAALLTPLSRRLVLVRDLSFADRQAAVSLLRWLAQQYRGRADVLAVGGDARGELGAVLRGLPGVSGRAEVLVKAPGLSVDRQQPIHFVLG